MQVPCAPRGKVILTAAGLLAVTIAVVALETLMLQYVVQLDMKEFDETTGKAHQGFYTALFYVKPKAKKGDKENKCIFHLICDQITAALTGNDKKLYITGHSLGKSTTIGFQ